VDHKGEPFYAIVRVKDLETGIDGIVGCFRHEHFAKLALSVARDFIPGACSLYVVSGTTMLNMLKIDFETSASGRYDFSLENFVEKLVAEIGKRVTDPLSPDVAFTAESDREPSVPHHPESLCPPASAVGRQDINHSEEE
jgi:hypothetical protein